MSVYKEILDKILLSFSSLHSYETCPYSFYLNKIEGEKGISNGYAQSGNYGHEALEQIFTKKVTPEEALQNCVNEFEDYVTEYISEDSLQKKMDALCQYLADLDIDSFFEKYEVLGVEKRFKWKISFFNMIGFADLILRRKSDGKVILVDHKSAGHFMKADGKTPLKNQIDNFTTYKKQMYLYADAMKKTMGFYPDLIVWNHFLDGGKKTVIEFNEKDLEESLKWAENIVDQMYNDEEFVENQSYMMCNVLCNYRDMCEYLVEDDD